MCSVKSATYLLTLIALSIIGCSQSDDALKTMHHETRHYEHHLTGEQGLDAPEILKQILGEALLLDDPWPLPVRCHLQLLPLILGHLDRFSKSLSFIRRQGSPIGCANRS